MGEGVEAEAVHYFYGAGDGDFAEQQQGGDVSALGECLGGGEGTGEIAVVIGGLIAGTSLPSGESFRIVRGVQMPASNARRRRR